MENIDYEQKKRECWNKFCESHPTLSKTYPTLKLFNFIFDYIHHNLTSDAEGEEMLTVSRKRVQEEYRESIKKAQPYNINSYNRGFHVGCATMLKELFGSKCLPDEPANEDNFASKEPKPAEPKYKVGDKVITPERGKNMPLTIRCKTGKHYYAFEEIDYDIHESYLKPYTEPKKGGVQ